MPTCTPALTACGGNVVGSWHYASGCISTDALFGQARMACPALTLTNVTGDSRGLVIFSATTVNRVIKTNVAGTINLPASCNFTMNCQQVQTALANAAKTVTCAGTTGACACDFTAEFATSGNPPYTLGTNQFTTDPATGQARTYNYCINGAGSTVFTYQETTATPRDPGIFVMNKK